MELTIIAGIAENNVIGKGNDLPWHISEDLKRFKELTLNKPVIMGRKTYESIVNRLGKPLPERTNIVITSDKNYLVLKDVIVANSVHDAIEKAKKIGDKAFVIGGQTIYEQAINSADKLEITHVHQKYDGDAYFPEINKGEWKETKRESKTGKVNFSFVTYERNKQEAKNKGMFIVFDGIDGSGKSTQVRKLAEHIYKKSKYNHVVLTRNPYQDTNIRRVLIADNNPHTQADKLADLFIADRGKHAENIVIPSLEGGLFVLCDRHKLSTICYQSAQGLDMNDLIKRHEGLPVPDMTFIVDVSAEVAKSRMQKEDASVRGKEHKFEANLDFARELRKNYHKAVEIMKKNGEKIFIINGDRTPEEIFSEIKGIFDKETQ